MAPEIVGELAIALIKALGGAIELRDSAEKKRLAGLTLYATVVRLLKVTS